jgi:hypothetical protein
MGYSKPQKTLINQDNEEISTQQSVKKIKQSDTVEQKINKINPNALETDVIDCSSVNATSKPTHNNNFCQHCQKQFACYSSLYQHKKSVAHLNAVKGSKPQFKVGEETILTKDYDALISEKGWLCDAVSFINYS